MPIRRPGAYLGRGGRFAQDLMRQEAAAPPITTHTQGLASMLRQGLAGYAGGQDERQRQEAQEAFMSGMQAKPWIDPDTGQPVGTAGGIPGAQAALQGVGGEYGRNLQQQLMMTGMDRDYAAQIAATARKQQLADIESERGYKSEEARLKAERAEALEETKRGEGPFRGTGMEAQQRNILASGDTGSQDYAAAYADLAAPKMRQDPQTGAWTTFTPDMSMYASPTFQRPGQAPPTMPLPYTQIDGGPSAPAPQPAALPAAAPRGGAPTRPFGAPKVTTALGGIPRLTAAEKAVDTAFGKEYATTIAGGGMADVQKNLSQLDDVVATLESGADDYTGPVIGSMPDWLKATTMPKAAATQEAVEEVVQRNLRVVLGAQFTEKEGIRLIARAYNPRLEEAENAKRVRRLRTAIADTAKAKLAASQYFEQNGTLKGYKGSTRFSIKDIEDAAFGGDAAQGGWSIRKK